MIYQSGYLTIKAYDRDFNTFLLDFPNNEVKNGFLTMLSAAYLQPKEETGGWIRSLVVALRRGDVEQVRTLFTSFSPPSCRASPIRCGARRTSRSVSVTSSTRSI